MPCPRCRHLHKSTHSAPCPCGCHGATEAMVLVPVPARALGKLLGYFPPTEGQVRTALRADEVAAIQRRHTQLVIDPEIMPVGGLMLSVQARRELSLAICDMLGCAINAFTPGVSLESGEVANVA